MSNETPTLSPIATMVLATLPTDGVPPLSTKDIAARSPALRREAVSDALAELETAGIVTSVASVGRGAKSWRVLDAGERRRKSATVDFRAYLSSMGATETQIDEMCEHSDVCAWVLACTTTKASRDNFAVALGEYNRAHA